MVRWKREIEELLGAMKEVKGWKEDFRLIKKEVKEGISKQRLKDVKVIVVDKIK